MNHLEKNYSDIEKINEMGITFNNGNKIIFKDCIGNRYNSETCIAERNITASPPYFEFFTLDLPIRIIFNQKGILAKHKNNNNFRDLQKKINDMGYTSYDLS